MDERHADGKLALTLLPQALNGLANAFSVAAGFGYGALDHHLRRKRRPAPESSVVNILSAGVLGQGQGIRPAQKVPKRDVVGQGEHARVLVEIDQEGVRRGTHSAAFAGEQLHDDGLDRFRLGAHCMVGPKHAGERSHSHGSEIPGYYFSCE